MEHRITNFIEIGRKLKIIILKNRNFLSFKIELNEKGECPIHLFESEIFVNGYGRSDRQNA